MIYRFQKISHPAYEYWDTFPTSNPLPFFGVFPYIKKRMGFLEGDTLDRVGGSPKKDFFAFLHGSEHVLILIFVSGKMFQKLRNPPTKWKKFHFFFLMNPSLNPCTDFKEKIIVVLQQ